MSAARSAFAITAVVAVVSGAIVPTRDAPRAVPPQRAGEQCAPPSAAERSAVEPAAAAPEPTVAELRQALGRFAQAADAAARRRRWADQVRALGTVARIYNFLGLPDSALAAAEGARGMLARANEPGLEPAVRAVYGETLQSRGSHAEALSQYASGLETIRTVGAPSLAAVRGRLCGNVGVAFLELGQLDSAQHYLERALALRTALGDREGEAVTLGNLGRLLQALGRADSSLVVFDSVLAIRRARPNAVAEALALNNKGYAYDLLGLPDSALAAYGGAARLIHGRHPSHEGLTLLNRGRAYLAFGRLAEARRDIEDGLVLERMAGDSAGESWALHDLGRVALAERRWDVAIAALNDARRLMRDQGDRIREGSALYYLGVVHHTRGSEGDLRRAAAYYDSAAAVRTAVARTTTRDEDRVVFAEQDLQLTARWALAWLALADTPGRRDSAASGSLLAAERGRARALHDLLRAATVAGESGLRVADTTAGGGYPVGGDELLRVPAATRAPVLSYLVTDRALLAWLALPDGSVRVHCQRVARASIDTLVAGLRAQLWAAEAERTSDAPRGRPATLLGAARDSLPPSCDSATLAASRAVAGGRDSLLAATARLLIPPALLAALPADTAELVIVPHAALGLVPFAALPANPVGVAFGVRYAIRYAPSLALLAAVERGAARNGDDGRPARSLIIGDPLMPEDPDAASPFAPLSLARETAHWLAGRLGTNALVGSRATEQAVLGSIATTDLVHLGTHGRAYGTEAQARRSFVALAPDGADDGLLTMAEIMAGPRLHAALVVLSACQTGLGDLKSAEGTVGLQRAFLARGARSVLVTLWQVDATATDSLVRKFYRYWLDERSPRTKAQALRLAQAEVQQLPLARRNPPHYWAGFQLVGAR